MRTDFSSLDSAGPSVFASGSNTRATAVDALSDAWAVVSPRQLGPGIPQVGSGAVKLGSGDIGKCACQGLTLCIGPDRDNRVIVEEGVSSSALSERIVDLDFYIIRLRFMA